MANAHHLAVLRQGTTAWNSWRNEENRSFGFRPDFIGADLSGTNLNRADLREANLTEANLSGADLSGADLNGTNLNRADLSGTNLSGTNLTGANLNRADLREADLFGANLNRADLREANLREAKNLSEANLTGANLSGANLSGTKLSGTKLNMADLREADLREADLFGADLTEANLSGANLFEANLSGADLTGADLSGANLFEANLSGADLSGADLSGTNLFEANLSGANLSETNLSEADLRQVNFVDARLDYADLTGAKLWETQRSGWSIKGITCRRALWDREGEEPTTYGEGEFERIFAETPRIVLRYPGGMSPVDLLALPLIVERLQTEHPGSVLQVRSVQNDAGGASVTITVEDLENRGTEAFAAEVDALHGDLLAIQHRLHSEESLRLKIEAKYQAVVQDVLPMLLEKAIPKQEFRIGRLTAPMVIKGPIMRKGDTYHIPGQAGAVGPGAHAHDNIFQQIQGGIDLPNLAEELGRLRDAMKGEATGAREQDKAIGAVADAEEAAAKGDGPAALQYLRSAGTWALKIAEKIGVAVAAEALKKAM